MSSQETHSPRRRSLRRALPFILLAVGVLILVSALRPQGYTMPAYDWSSFRSLPVLEGGRIKPLDSVARNKLLILGNKQTWQDASGDRRPAIEWLAQMLMDPRAAAEQPVFRIDHPDVVGMLGARNDERKYFSFAEILPKWNQISQQATLVNPDHQLRSGYERALVQLVNSVHVYNDLNLSLQPPPLLSDSATGEYRALAELLRQQLAPPDEEAAAMGPQAMELMRSRYTQLAAQPALKMVPPPPGQGDQTDAWRNVGEVLLHALSSGVIDPVAVDYAALADHWQAGDSAAFNATLAELRGRIDARYTPARETVGYEVFFNSLSPFITSTSIYVLAFLAVCLSWLVWGPELRRGAFWLLLLALALHTFGLAARVYIQGRPPVTNLYSSAVFAGWFSVVLAAVLERLFRNGFGSAIGSIIGVLTLIVAHHQATGDTMEMMRAVLDSNFWLATHVITVTIGYSATFLAGGLAIAYIVGGRLKMKAEDGRALERMVYGIVCFALLFSFVGTVLGGIWADQSWGRFWGWDPKENGAMMIVLWNALLLHTRWGKLTGPVGLMQLVIVGNIITAWSWFGTNLLGIGLHAYGFTDKGFLWLVAFVGSQLLLIALGIGMKAPRPNRTV